MSELPILHDDIPDVRQGLTENFTTTSCSSASSSAPAAYTKSCGNNDNAMSKLSSFTEKFASSPTLASDKPLVAAKRDDDNNNNNTKLNTREGANILTTAVIMKECVAQGFYRNPICNEKLYLHHKSFTDIDPRALIPYTDVKVLWLEGNALKEIQCGRTCVLVKAPHIPNPFESDSESSSENESNEMITDAIGQSESSQTQNIYVDPTDDAAIAAHIAGENTEEQHTKHLNEMASAEKCRCGDGANMEETYAKIKKVKYADLNTIEECEIDVFSSQYRKLRQLYLHNNVLRQFPDLHRFEMLHSLNLSDNFIEQVDAHCPHFHAALENYEREKSHEYEMNMHLSKSAQREEISNELIDTNATIITNNEEEEMECSKEDSSYFEEGGKLTVNNNNKSHVNGDTLGSKSINSHEEVVERVKLYASFCPHCALPENDNDNKTTNREGANKSNAKSTLNNPPRWRAKKVNGPALCFRNLCSSLHTLHIANNRLSSFDDCIGLVCFKNLQSLDISNNNISDGEMMLVILEQISKLKSLKCQGNPFVRTLSKYRKRILSKCVSLLYLDDRPVFDEERRLISAWTIGGADEEEKERNSIRSEKAELAEKRLRDFRKMLREHQSANSHPLVQTLLPNCNDRQNSSSNSNHINNNVYTNTNLITNAYTDSPTSSESDDNDDDDDNDIYIAVSHNDTQDACSDNIIVKNADVTTTTTTTTTINNDSSSSNMINNEESNNCNSVMHSNVANEQSCTETTCNTITNKGNVKDSKCAKTKENVLNVNEISASYLEHNVDSVNLDENNNNSTNSIYCTNSADTVTRVLSSNGNHISRSVLLRSDDMAYTHNNNECTERKNEKANSICKDDSHNSPRDTNNNYNNNNNDVVDDDEVNDINESETENVYIPVNYE